MSDYLQPTESLAVRDCDVLIAGGGTGGVVAALAAARNGAKTILVETKGYLGGTVVEGGTALHSFYNLWKAFPGVEKRQVIGGIPAEIVDRLIAIQGGCSGHAEMLVGYDYDSICTAIDTELYKVVCMEMCQEAGVEVLLNTFLADAVAKDGQVIGGIAQSRSGREMIKAQQFVDATGYGDLAAGAGADFSEPNDYPVANSIGMGGVSIEKYYAWLKDNDALKEYSEGLRDGEDNKIVRLMGYMDKLPDAFKKVAREIGMACVITTTHDDYFMFVKLNMKLDKSPTDRDTVAAAELELRKRANRAVELFREFVPGCEKAYITRTSPSLCIRRGRLITCDYDITSEDVLEARHFEDDVMAYGFHDFAPRLQVGGGQTYGIPFRALRPVGLDNLLVTGMMITSDHDAHMSTRNTVSCMAQGQAAGTAAALCAAAGCGTRDLPYDQLRQALLDDGVILEN